MSLAARVTALPGLNIWLLIFSQTDFIEVQHTPKYAFVMMSSCELGITPTALERGVFGYRLQRHASIMVYSRFYTPSVMGGSRLMILQSPVHIL